MKKHQVIGGRYVLRALFMRHGFYHARVRDIMNGHLREKSSRESNKRKAEQAILQWIESMLKVDEKGVITPINFRKAGEEYLMLKQLRPSTRIEYNTCFAIFNRAFGTRYVHEIGFKEVEQFLKDSELVRSARTRRKHLTHLRSFFRWAHARKYTSEREPLMDIKVPSAAVHIGKALNHAEARKLLDACRYTFTKALKNKKGAWTQKFTPPEYLFFAVLLSLHTGLRRKNILNMRWKDIDIPNRKARYIADDMKATREHELPMHWEVMHFLQGRVGGPDDRVLGIDLKAISKAFKSALKRAGLRDIRWHDLRHTFSTWVGIRAPYAVQQALMSHSPGKSMTLHYTHVPFEVKQAAIDAMPCLVHETYVPGVGCINSGNPKVVREPFDPNEKDEIDYLRKRLAEFAAEMSEMATAKKDGQPESLSLPPSPTTDEAAQTPETPSPKPQPLNAPEAVPHREPEPHPVGRLSVRLPRRRAPGRARARPRQGRGGREPLP